MSLQDSPLWWLFSMAGAAIWFVVMLPAMPTRNHKIFVSIGPLAVFAVIALYCLKSDENLTEMLPVYCGLVISVPVGILGHRKALREMLADPEVPYGEATGPWTLQAAVSLAVFLGLAVYYVSH
ncbi:hypothetical protein ACIQWV_14490 [Streptomyces sp. NPDC098085]|uniref:hypothetical protein n=1 Tax=Streptomyces sp. NPDC098085 TaxID=3366094 RepID=UPI003829753C